MNYPLISEYIEAIKSAEDNFDVLKNLRPVLDENGEPVMTSGNFAVVFKMKDEQTGKLHAVKCFLKEQEGRAEAYRMIAEELKNVDSPYLTSVTYLDKELFVDSDQTAETEFPVLLMDWVAGKTLDKYLRENLDDQYALEMLAYRFSQLAQWLIPQPFAHGDLKPDNILVRENGSLVLVDYDGMYVPAMKGQKARELGSPDFRHPQRTENDFDEHIDDFPLVSILLSLKAISVSPELLDKYGADNRLLFSQNDYCNLADSCIMGVLKQLLNDIDLATLHSLFILSSCQKQFSQLSINFFDLKIPEGSKSKDIENLSIEVTDEDLANAWIDEFGVYYSSDGTRLLKASKDLASYSIREGTIIICSKAFYNNKVLKIYFPNSIKHIGNESFGKCCTLNNIVLPPTLVSIGEKAFYGCDIFFHTIVIPYSVEHIGDGAFSLCGCKVEVYSNHFKVINNILYSFSDNEIRIIYCPLHIQSVKIHPNTSAIGDYAFDLCNITSIKIPTTCTYIGKFAFHDCNGLHNVIMPDTVIHIGEYAFNGCHSLKSIKIPSSVATLGKFVFSNCIKLKDVQFHASISYIPEGAFESCDSIKSLFIPDSVIEIKDEAFAFCYSLEIISIPSSVVSIGQNVFFSCRSLNKILLSDSISSIGKSSFSGCESLQSIILPRSLTCIESQTFAFCSIREIKISEKVKSIEEEAFLYGLNINELHIPSSVESIGPKAFDGCHINILYIDNPQIAIYENSFSNFNSLIIPNGFKREFIIKYPWIKDRIKESIFI